MKDDYIPHRKLYILPVYKQSFMKIFQYMRFLIAWCIAIHIFDVWSTYHLAAYYGWEGELNYLVKDFISQGFVNMVVLKLAIVLPVLYTFNWLWDTTIYYDNRHIWAIRILLFYNLMATGLMFINLYQLCRIEL